MSETFHVVFSGKIIEHADIDMVKHNVARAFKLPAEQVEKLFCGKRIALKKNVDAATAEKYQSTLQRAGALCEIINADSGAAKPAAAVQPAPQAQITASKSQTVEEAAQQEQAQPAETTVTETNDDGMSIAEVGVTLVEATPFEEANIDTSGMDMDEVGVTLVEATPFEEANIDTSGMDMDEVGVTLVEAEPVAEPEIDTSGMDMDEVGVTLVEAEPVAEPEIDISGIDMDEVGVTLAESEPVPDANIDTSSLKLAE